VLLAETFVDLSRFKGTCYRAANWVWLGQPLGETYTRRDGSRARGCPKAVYVYPLSRDARRRLRSPEGGGRSAKAATELSAEQLREVAAWIEANRDGLPDSVRSFLDLHRRYLAAGEGDPLRRALEAAWREVRRALHLTPSSEKRRSSGSPLAGIPGPERVQAKSEREELEARIARGHQLSGWHDDLKGRHDEQVERLEKRLAKMPKKADDGAEQGSEEIPPLGRRSNALQSSAPRARRSPTASSRTCSREAARTRR
jgi:hypothetical protein